MTLIELIIDLAHETLVEREGRTPHATLLSSTMESDMKTLEAKKLKVGERVRWSDGANGEVIDKNWHALQIKWDDGQASIFNFNHNEPQWHELSVAA
jgi:hypothetical protein